MSSSLVPPIEPTPFPADPDYAGPVVLPNGVTIYDFPPAARREETKETPTVPGDAVMKASS